MDELYTGELIIGTGIGDDLEAVIKSKGEPDKREHDELIYHGRFSNGLEYVHFVNMDDGEVFEITVDMMSKNDSINDALFDQLVAAMDERYQKSRPADGFATWKAPSPSGKLVEVSLVDESMEIGSPMIMLNYLENYERTFTED
jgi:hypothetical protein